MDIVVRKAEEGDFERIVELNDAVVQQTSAMDVERLRELDRLSCFHKVVVVDGHVAAFLLAMREDAPYPNDNHAWFAARFLRFVYVDRVVVGSDFAGLSIGSRLYRELFDYVRLHGIDAVTCEYNVQPPNIASQRFHDKFGFKEVGTQWVAGGTKKVSLQASDI
ncbi:MAG TPA: GNAT family N-acetyltransferase [Rhodanobacter sp.]